MAHDESVVCNLQYVILLLQINCIEAGVIRTDKIEAMAENRSSLEAVPAFFWLFGDEFGTSSKLGHFGATRTFPQLPAVHKTAPFVQPNPAYNDLQLCKMYKMFVQT